MISLVHIDLLRPLFTDHSLHKIFEGGYYSNYLINISWGNTSLGTKQTVFLPAVDPTHFVKRCKVTICET